MHILWIICLFFIPIDFWQVLGFYILFYVFGIQIGFHRLVSHKAFVPKYNWVKHVLSIIGTGALLGGPIAWSQFHRWHHGHSDTEKDPQNIGKGRWHAHYGWFFNPIYVSPIIVRDILVDKKMIFIDKYCKWFPIVFLLLALIISPITFMACLTGMILASQVDMSINSLIGHSPTKGLKNNPWLSIITAGTSLHKNHHDRPNAYNFGVKWYELDPCKFIVPLLSK
jgi:stearoyl-CoA desaturase (delta-9 desaturase)